MGQIVNLEELRPIADYLIKRIEQEPEAMLFHAGQFYARQDVLEALRRLTPLGVAICEEKKDEVLNEKKREAIRKKP